MGFDSVLEVESGFYCLEFVKKAVFLFGGKEGI